MNSINKKLTNTATILANLPRVIDLADERELEILAALLKGYADCEGPGEWGETPGYLEAIALAALVREGRSVDKDFADSFAVRILQIAMDYVRTGKGSGSDGEHEERFEDYTFLRKVLHLAESGTMRRAFELVIAEEDNKQREQERQKAYAESPAGKRHQEAIDSVEQTIKRTLAEKDRVMGQQSKGPQAVKPKRKARKAA